MSVLTAHNNGWLLELSLLLVVVSALAARSALRQVPDSPPLDGNSTAVGRRPHHPVLIMNPWSGGGKVEKFNLVEECRKREIEPVVLSVETTCSNSPATPSTAAPM